MAATDVIKTSLERNWGNETRAVSDMLGILVYDNVVHGSQIAYLRGYYKGLGWIV